MFLHNIKIKKMEMVEREERTLGFLISLEMGIYQREWFFNKFRNVCWEEDDLLKATNAVTVWTNWDNWGHKKKGKVIVKLFIPSKFFRRSV